MPAEEVFSLYRDEIEHANVIVAATPLDTPPPRQDPRWPGWPIPDLRWIIVHMIKERPGAPDTSTQHVRFSMAAQVWANSNLV